MTSLRNLLRDIWATYSTWMKASLTKAHHNIIHQIWQMESILVRFFHGIKCSQHITCAFSWTSSASWTGLTIVRLLQQVILVELEGWLYKSIARGPDYPQIKGMFEKFDHSFCWYIPVAVVDLHLGMFSIAAASEHSIHWNWLTDPQLLASCSKQ